MSTALVIAAASESGTQVANGNTWTASNGSNSTLQLGTNGSVSLSAVTGQNWWFTPNQPGIGSSYWCKMVVNSGTAPTTGTTGSVISLSAGQTWTWNSLHGVANYTLTFYSDAGGTQLVGTCTVLNA